MEVYDRLVDEAVKTFWPVSCEARIHIYRGDYEMAVARIQKELAEEATQSNEVQRLVFFGWYEHAANL